MAKPATKTSKPSKEASKSRDDLFEDGDDSLVVDMDAVEAQSYEAIPKGTYECVIEECEFMMSNSSGKPMWSLTLTITEGEYANRKLFTNMSFSEKALPMTKTQIQRIAPDLISKRFDPRKIAADGSLIGVTCRAKTKVENYEGEDRTRVQTLLAPKGGNDDFLDS